MWTFRLWQHGLIMSLTGLLLLCLSVQESRAQQWLPVDESVAELFPSATRTAEPDPELGIIPVYQLDQLLGYVFESDQLTNFPGFSGETVNLRIALDSQGVIRGIKIVRHHEPIFLYGLGMTPLLEFIDQYLNRSIDQRLLVGAKSGGVDAQTQYIDGITKATVSVMVVHDTILAAAMRVARLKLSGFEAPAQAAFKQGFEPLSVPQLQRLGYLQPWRLSQAEAAAQVDESPQRLAAMEQQEGREFIDIQWAMLNSELVGRNLLGEEEYQRLMAELAPGELALLMTSNGALSFIEPDFTPGTSPNRLSLYQNGFSVDIRDLHFYSYYPRQFVADFPEYQEVKLFRIKANSGFDLTTPFSFRMTLFLSSNPIQSTSVSLSREVRIAKDLIEILDVEVTEPVPLWQRLWQQRLAEIIVLSVYLLLLTWVFVFQRQLSPRFGIWLPQLRFAALLFVVAFIGYYAQGQLSVVNIYTLLLSLWNGFEIQVFLLDPVIFLLWCFVFVSLFLWGRGLYCGWLCPFGAMQELLGLMAQKFRLPQWKPKDALHRRLQLIKYPILLLLVGMAFDDLSAAETLAEVEPFKTAVTMNFVRYWPFTLYAVLLLAAGLFIHKFYCRYLCPLGAGLAVLGRLRRFSWLRRRDECGSPCQLCNKQCQIKAIRDDGRIDYDECIQCLECLVIIDNSQRCVVSRYGNKRKKRALNQDAGVKVVAIKTT